MLILLSPETLAKLCLSHCWRIGEAARSNLNGIPLKITRCPSGHSKRREPSIDMARACLPTPQKGKQVTTRITKISRYVWKKKQKKRLIGKQESSGVHDVLVQVPPSTIVALMCPLSSATAVPETVLFTCANPPSGFRNPDLPRTCRPKYQPISRFTVPQHGRQHLGSTHVQPKARGPLP